MPIISINRDNYVGGPSIVRLTTSDTLSNSSASGYLTSQLPIIASLNNGDFDWSVGDMVALFAADGNGIFQFSGNDFSTLIPLEAGSFQPGPLNNLLAYVTDGIGDSGIRKDTVVLNAISNTMASSNARLYLFQAPGLTIESGGGVTVNAQCGQIETISLTTAPGAQHILTITSNNIPARAIINFTYATYGTNTAGDSISFKYIPVAAGSCNVAIINNNAVPLNGSIGFTFSIVG